MIEHPDSYVSILTSRMLQRQRGTDDIGIRLTKARLYRQMFIAHKVKADYISNEDGKQNATVRQINRVLRKKRTQ